MENCNELEAFPPDGPTPDELVVYGLPRELPSPSARDIPDGSVCEEPPDDRIDGCAGMDGLIPREFARFG